MISFFVEIPLTFEEAISSDAFEAVLARFVFSEEVELLLRERDRGSDRDRDQKDRERERSDRDSKEKKYKDLRARNVDLARNIVNIEPQTAELVNLQPQVQRKENKKKTKKRRSKNLQEAFKGYIITIEASQSKSM